MAASILLNALHTTTGGGLIYLQNVLPHLAKDERFAFTLLAPKETFKKLTLPKGLKKWEAPALGFASGHAWEQLKLPFLARQKGFAAMWCNANYVPLLARNPIPTLHTTPRAAAQALSWGMRVYWLGVRWLTMLSLVRSKVALSISGEVADDYVGPGLSRKVRLAPAAAPLFGGKIKKNPHLVVAVGDYYPQKNYAQLLRAMKLLHGRLPEAKLEIIGRPVDPAVTATVSKLITDLHLHKFVKEVGPLPHDKLMRKVATASALVSLSKAEAFNMPVLEALGAGTPVVTGNISAPRDLTEGAAVLVPLDKGGDVMSVVAVALHDVLTNPTLARKLAAAGKQRAARFGWGMTAQTIADTLSDVLTPR